MSWSVEISSPVAAPRLFKAAVLEWHNLGPKLVPEIIASANANLVEGGVGSVRQFNFTPVMPFSFAKERLDFVDTDKFELKQSLVEGGGIGEKIESASSHYQFQPKSDGGCICKVHATYKLLPGVEIAGDEIVKGKEAVTGAIKAAEGYLLANPQAYA